MSHCLSIVANTNLMQMLVDYPRILPKFKNLLKIPGTDKVHPLTSPETNVDSLQGIRKSFKQQNISSKAINIIMQSWRKSTQKQYSSFTERCPSLRMMG